MKEEENWDMVIKPRESFFSLKLKEVWEYRDLILLFVRRDVVSLYQQTILGPFWYIFQPLASTITFTFVFGSIAKISTDNLPAPLFYLSGLTTWNFFTACLNKNSSIFVNNSSIFGKVYFPRLTVPASNILSSFITFGIQFLVLIAFIIYYKVMGDASFTIQYSWLIMIVPLLIAVSLLGLGIGMILSSLTTKYRDVSFLIGFGVQLLMYCSTVIFPLKVVPESLKIFVQANPVTSYIDAFRFIFTGHMIPSPYALLYSVGVTIFLFFLGIMMFNKVERTFMDTV